MSAAPIGKSTAHRPVLLAEALAALAIRADGIYVDATFGRGGHSRAILERLGPAGRLIALDRDPAAVAAAREIKDPRFVIEHAPFSELAQVLAPHLKRLGASLVHGVLADLGVSSPQIEDPTRGFSFRTDGPLDMRMDPSRGISAADWLASATEQQIREAIASYGEERFAKQVAKAIVAARAREPLLRTEQLAAVVATAVRTREAGQNPATRTFQALRILVNQELEEITMMLPQATAQLAPEARLVVIAFHSLEDRLVKRFLRACAADNLPADLPIRARDLPQPPLRILGKAVRASEAEVAANPRARSATLRAAERSNATLDASILQRAFSAHGPDAWRS
ncbi:MAG: 16S rRNA (cytosine(1402)-N(4))-methyltransferase RsmH [Betaproteobacteria bacterium]|nr:16S rRNA (cytosine(1402)-N(4))-methyltransferase RsmH [Betaproteobacteria bacterium]